MKDGGWVQRLRWSCRIFLKTILLFWRGEQRPRDDGGRKKPPCQRWGKHFFILTNSFCLTHRLTFSHYDARQIVLMWADSRAASVFCCCVCSVRKSITGNSTPVSCFQKLHLHTNPAAPQLTPVSTPPDVEKSHLWEGLCFEVDQAARVHLFCVSLFLCSGSYEQSIIRVCQNQIN